VSVPTPSFDVLIHGGRVIDGGGNPWFRADVGIRGDRIAAVGPLDQAAARLRLDATGKVVAPGFIDAHVHGDLALLTDPLHEAAVRQGVTTYILGQDGVAMAPASADTLEYMCRYTAGFSGGRDWLATGRRPAWSSMAEYLACFDGRCAVNVACLVPNGNVRHAVLGLDTRPPTGREQERMAALVAEAMDQGAVGLSSGLDYIPSRYAAEEELTALCRAIAPYGGVYVTHMRRYDPAGVIESMDEVYRIGRDAGVGVHISHFNSRADLVVPKIDAVRAAGVDLTFDLYCYLAGSTILGMVALPPWAQEGGLAATVERLAEPGVRDRLRREWFPTRPRPLGDVRLSYVSALQYRMHEGRTLDEGARAAGARDLADFVCDLLIASEMAVGCVVPHLERGPQDVAALMRHPAMMGGSDGIYTGSRPHPRGWGCFARYLGPHVRDEHTWGLETAVQRLAASPARRFGLRDRGLLVPGFAADVVVFDPATVGDRSTFEDGRQLAAGMEHVLVNGEVVLHAGRRTAALPGRGLKRL
jgi:N-acyl-D-amino-acid deacylase